MARRRGGVRATAAQVRAMPDPTPSDLFVIQVLDGLYAAGFSTHFYDSEIELARRCFDEGRTVPHARRAIMKARPRCPTCQQDLPRPEAPGK